MTEAKYTAIKFFLELHAVNKGDGLRLGQRFCNKYIKESWPELYYEADDKAATALIEDWLARHQYTDCLPPSVQRINLPH